MAAFTADIILSPPLTGAVGLVVKLSAWVE